MGECRGTVIVMLSFAGRGSEQGRRTLESMVDSMRAGAVVVEGLHDIALFARHGITAIGFHSFMMARPDDPMFDGSRTIYVVMDADKGGADKTAKAVQKMEDMGGRVRWDTECGRRFLRILKITSVEMARAKMGSMLRAKEECFSFAASEQLIAELSCSQ